MSGNKKAFALRLSPELMEALEKWAADEFRSVNGQIEFLLTQAVRARNKNKSKTKQDGESDL
jgi:hypothetical protein